jgi:cytoskeletal protein RodZ
MKEENFSDVQKLIALKRHEQPNDTYFEELLDEFHRRQRLELQKRPACSPIRERVGNWFSETSNWKLIWAGSLAYSVLLGVFFIWPKDIVLNAPEIPNAPVKHVLPAGQSDQTESDMPIPEKEKPAVRKTF